MKIETCLWIFKILLKIFVILAKRNLGLRESNLCRLSLGFKNLWKIYRLVNGFCLFVTSTSGKERSEFDRCNGWFDGRMCIMLPGFRDDYVCSSQPTGFLVSNHEVNKNKNDKPISSFIIRLFSF
jgi:hypothetical protein